MSGGRRFVCFSARGQAIGVPIEEVKETLELRPITKVPLVPPFVAGIVNLRGEVVAALDLAALLGLPDGPLAPATRLVLVKARRTAGLLVDAVSAVRTIGDDAIVPVPPGLPPAGAALLDGLVSLEDGPLLLLSAARLLECDGLRPFQRAS